MNDSGSSPKSKTGKHLFKKGESGNPSGRKKLTEEEKQVRKVDGKIFAEFWLKDSNGRNIIEKVFMVALDPDHKNFPWAVDFITNRVHGKVTDKVAISSTRLTVIKDPDGKAVMAIGRIEKDEE
jgi:hypothetical protein